MKFSSSVTQSVIECLRESKSDIPSAKAKAANRPKPSLRALSPAESAESSRKLGSILLVDHDAEVREFQARLLRGADYRVTCAADGEEAWGALCADRFDVLIVDHSLAKLSGLDLIRRLRVGPLNTLPCILVSGKIPWEEKDLLDIVRPGLALAKPFSFLELLTCVRCVMPARSADAAAILHLPATSQPQKVARPDPGWHEEARGEPPRRRLARVG